MKTLLSMFILVSTFVSPFAFSYYGPNSTEAKLEFDGKIHIRSKKFTLQSLKIHPQKKENILAAINTQTDHLMGILQSESFIDSFGAQGVLGESSQVRITGVTTIPDGTSNPFHEISYHYSATSVFNKAVFRSKDIRKVPLVLPIDPLTIYQHGMVGKKNTCTDEHYDTEDDFWYFWDPYKAGCPLADASEDILYKTVGTITKYENTKVTYPEYQKLYSKNGNDSTMEIAIFLGYIDDVNNLKRANRRDDAMHAFHFIEDFLLESDYELIESKNNFRETADYKTIQGINFLRILEKNVRIKENEMRVRIKILLADTALDSRDETFHHHYVEGLENADIMVYDGHSGLGGNLHLDSFPGVNFNPRKYQIFFFNGCSSYPYYNGMYFDAKGGSKNLDIITSGLPTFSDTAAANILAFLNNFLDGSTKTWQSILWELERSNALNGTYLTGINGDEDNVWNPSTPIPALNR